MGEAKKAAASTSISGISFDACGSSIRGHADDVARPCMVDGSGHVGRRLFRMAHAAVEFEARLGESEHDAHLLMPTPQPTGFARGFWCGLFVARGDVIRRHGVR